MQQKDLNRRDFLKWTAIGAASLAMASCAKPAEPTAQPTAVSGQPTTAPAKPTDTPAPVSKYSEAPMLAELVKAGKLPPVEERLPVNPYVFPVAEKIGKFGGTMRRCFKGVSDRWGPTKCKDHGLVWFDKDLNQQARAAESWEVNADGSLWSFHLRKGMKWSDGTPFTSGDFRWYFDNIQLNSDLTPAISSRWTSGPSKEVMTLETPDDYTVTFKYSGPNPLLILGLGRAYDIFVPGHFMKRYHMELTDDKAALDAEVKAAGFDSWTAYFTDRNYWYMNPDRPCYGAWLAMNPLSEELFVMERNPYFFGVDAEGQQLPYIDKITHRLFSTDDVKNMWVINGEIDFQARHMGFSDFTLYKESEAKGDYKVFLGVSAGHQALNTNHTCKDPNIREFFQNRDVRIALSVAVDRDPLNDLLFDGMAKPRQYSPIGMSPQYYAKLSDAHIEYDPAKANELLDKAGYDKKGSDGMRLWKDGSGPVSFIIEGTSATGTPGENAVLMIAKYFADVGIKATYKYSERSLYTEHFESNQIESAWWGGDRTVLPLVAPIIWTGRQPDRPWCVAWTYWDHDPTHPSAEEPPADHWIRAIWDIWDNQVSMESDAKKQTELFQKILDIWAEEIPYPCYLGEAPACIIVKNGFRNYLPGYPVDDPPGDEHLLNTETYFWEEPEKHM